MNNVRQPVLPGMIDPKVEKALRNMLTRLDVAHGQNLRFKQVHKNQPVFVFWSDTVREPSQFGSDWRGLQ